MMFKLLMRGQLIPVPPVEKALEFLGQEPKRSGAGVRKRRNIVGSPQRVREQIEAAAEEYGEEEVMIATMTYSHDDRRRSYELIAEAFSTPAQGTPG